ncbi:MAG: hypothetical protein JWM81_549 [Candidatus Saccharibacteria bacterium]|nr:hypothetical protein [Candidatus Saccharibacteria bacterium]
MMTRKQTRAKQEIGFLYINGLGDGTTTLKDKIVHWWWKRKSLDIHYAHINWYDGKSFEDKLQAVHQMVNTMLHDFGGVAIIGSSAGGSLALNAFSQLKTKNVCAVIAHGRLRAGNYNNRNSMHHRAHLDTPRPSRSFYDSVMYAEKEVIPSLSDDEKMRLLVLSQLTDLVVPLECMGIEGVEEHHSLVFGHSGGFVAHFLSDRDIISTFAQSQLP